MSEQLTIILTLIVIAFTIAWIFLFARQIGKKHVPLKTAIIAISAVVIILAGFTFALATSPRTDPAVPAVPTTKIILIDAIILCIFTIIGAISLSLSKGPKPRYTMTTRKITFLGILVGLASALMLLSFPILPTADYLRVELSGLIIFLTLLWFDWKTAAVVSLLTNLINVIIAVVSPVIPFLDQGINFLATMMFLLPMTLYLQKTGTEKKPNAQSVLLLTISGVVLNVVGMTLYNAFINIPLVYKITMPFSTVIVVFGFFNLLKWGLVALVINLTWRRLYSIRNFASSENDPANEVVK